MAYIPQQLIATWRFPDISTPDLWRLHKISIYALFGSVLLLHLVRRGDAPRWMAWFLVALTAAAMLSQSDGSRILVVLLAVVLFAPERLATGAFTAILVAFGSCSILLPFLARPLFGFLDGAGLLVWKSLTIGARLELWAAIAETVRERLWFGHGANTLQMRGELIAGLKYYPLTEMIGAHNNSMEIWYDLGLAGILIYVACFAAAARLALRLRGQDRRTAMALVLCVLVPLSVDHRLWLSWLLGYIGLVAVAAVLVIRQNGGDDQPRPSHGNT
jgi:O-antigen ligase